jgi:predicted amidohydrolase
MFDVNVSATEIYRESSGYRPGAQAVLADAGLAKIGMSVCYDLRFPHLFRALAKAGAQIIDRSGGLQPHHRRRPLGDPCCAPARSKPAASCWPPPRPVSTPKARGKGRRTYGHSLAVAPWGEVLADAGTEPGVTWLILTWPEVDKGPRAGAQR